MRADRDSIHKEVGTNTSSKETETVNNIQYNSQAIMKICAACHEDLPKDSYSKKQWKLDQRRCKVCITNNRAVQPISSKQDNNDPNTNEIVKTLDSMYLENADRKISDEELFKRPPPKEDCPICLLRIPTLVTGYKYQTCCGKVICSGCIHAPVFDHQGNEVDNEKCPFCRSATPFSDEEVVERTMKRVDLEDPIAINNLGFYYRDGMKGFPQDFDKSLELFHRAADLGGAKAYLGIGFAYDIGKGLEVDKKKSTHYYELSAIKGNVDARHNLGITEEGAGNIDRAVKHHMIAVRGGYAKSLEAIKEMYSYGLATKEDYTKALRLYQEYLSEIRSTQRDKAAAANEDYRYY